jgi:hypothetical protein
MCSPLWLPVAMAAGVRHDAPPLKLVRGEERENHAFRACRRTVLAL